MLIKFKFERIWYVVGLRTGLEAFRENRDTKIREEKERKKD